MEFLKISNVDVSKYIKSLSMSHEIIWNSKAGRGITAEYVGRIISRKWKLQLSTKPLSQAEVAKIMGLIEATDFVDITFVPTNNNGAPITRTFYANSPSTKVYSYAEYLKNVRYESIVFNTIEK